MSTEKNQEKITLPEDLQLKMLKFFMTTSIPRKVKQEREKKALAEKEKQE